MTIKLPLSLTVCALTLGACTTIDRDEAPRVLARAALADANGRSVGSATIEQTGLIVHLKATVEGLSPGEHGIHLHTAGKCEAPSFATAGGHLNPSAHQHGTLNAAGPHLGDLPNIAVSASWTGSLDVPLKGSSAEVLAQVLDADGTAVVVHAGPDDYKTDPAGNSGGRIACGVLVSEAR